ncbi:MAG: hypothetical protein ACYCXW_23880, partial [Solirubrobacteraceae bacterium]
RYSWINGVKTGNTNDAGYVLVASAQRDGLAMISAVLGTSSRQAADAGTLALMEWGDSQFRTWTPVDPGQVLARRGVAGDPGLRVPLVAKAGFARVLPRSSSVHVVVRAPRLLRGPLPARRVVGTAVVFDGRRALARIRLLVKRQVPAPGPDSGQGEPGAGQQTTPTTTTAPSTTTTAGQSTTTTAGQSTTTTGQGRTMGARLRPGLSTLAASVVFLGLGGWARRVRRTGWRFRRDYAIGQGGESKDE